MSNAFDIAALRFKDHEFKTVKLASYDVYRNGIPEWLIGLEIPSLILFPADHKDKQIKYTGTQHKTRSYMEFVEQNADKKFTLTERSHLPSRIARAPPSEDLPAPPLDYYHEIKNDDL